jgi:hypothetical protein
MSTELINKLFDLDKTNILSSILPTREVISRKGKVKVDNIRDGVTLRTEVYPIVYSNTSKLEPVIEEEAIINNLSLEVFQYTLAARGMLLLDGLEYNSLTTGVRQGISSGIDSLSVDSLDDIDFSDAMVMVHSDELEVPEDLDVKTYPVDVKADLGQGPTKVWSKNSILVLDSETPIGYLDIVRYLDEEDEYLLPLMSIDKDELGCSRLDYRVRFVPSVLLPDRATVYHIRSLEESDDTIESDI